MSHPYRSQPSKAFWKPTIAARHPLRIADWYDKKFDLSGAQVATAGSCFAQHIGRNMRQRGFAYLDAEPAPAALPVDEHADFSFGIYSARYGNIYTSRQFVQLIERALGRFDPVEDAWEKGDGIVDPFRPTLEPEPFGSVQEMRTIRAHHLERVLHLVESADLFVFTLGLTESWLSKRDGAAFPLCPGTAGGRFDDGLHQFHQLRVREVREDMERAFALMRGINPSLRFLLTVSPVPLAATATDQQVAVATMRSKSILRAAAGELYDDHDFVDYFPSYEIITSPFMQGFFFEPDKREVTPAGVDHVMSMFFAAHPPPGAQPGDTAPAQPPASPVSMPAETDLEREDRVKCDEELLAAFGPADGTDTEGRS